MVVGLPLAVNGEKELAIEQGDYHEDIPAITVITDGGWSKRSHRHSYNAESGVGVIIGLETRKILHLNVCNKYCAGCDTGSPQEQHLCYKNWESSSSAMETSAILKGFQEAEKIHGIRYTCFIRDGDCSQTCQPIFGQMRDMLTINAWVSNTMREIGSLRKIYGKYTVVHENIRTLHLILCVSIAIVGGNKTQMRESHTQCMRVGRSEFCVYHLAARSTSVWKINQENGMR